MLSYLGKYKKAESTDEVIKPAHSGDLSDCSICGQRIGRSEIINIENYGIHYDPDIGETLDDDTSDEDPNAYWPGMRPLYTTTIGPNKTVYARQGSVDKDTVEHYRALIRAGQTLPRIDVGIDNDEHIIIYNGHHRISAYFAEGMPAPVRVFEIHA